MVLAVAHQRPPLGVCLFLSLEHLEHLWSAVINLTSRAAELRSAPSGPDDRCRVAGKRALAPGVRGRRAITRVSSSRC